MTEQEFDAALIEAAFALGAQQGWASVSPAAAARAAGLDLATARASCSCTAEILRRFGQQADAAALTGIAEEGSVRDKLFDILLRRFDFMQTQRAGVLALLRYLPFNPVLALALYEMNLVSMGWLLEGAGVDATGLAGAAKKRGLLAVWAYGARAWAQDESEDLAHTMAAVDKALAQAETLVTRLATGTASPQPAGGDLPSPGEDAGVD
jgi:hypothetical protein